MNEYKVGQLWIDPEEKGRTPVLVLITDLLCRDANGVLQREQDYPNEFHYVCQSGIGSAFLRGTARDRALVRIDNITTAMLQYPDAFRDMTPSFINECKKHGWEF